ncbi:MAG: PBSX family phage terminase large subunit [Clostridium sp.]|uniref:PBSX family phage terminase large subunit n=1 Tax=Clostridium sp. TaxID=1506 RepID=UPI00290F9B71|nr:PBSX family phage terminase large subunit [Clostridium sp.]MDU7338599.1 PBSX family phage terminase large subunit [Clostridium sp.]
MWKKIDEGIAKLKKSLSDNVAKLRQQVSQGFFQFKPFSIKQKMVLTWWCPSSPVKESEGIIADGSIRSGKTVCMSLSFVMWAMNSFDGQNFAIAGKTIGSLRRNVMFWLKLMLKSRGYTVQDRRSENLMVVRRGNVINYFYQFGGKDERSQDLIQGITLAGVLFDEVALMPESFVNQATARCSVTGSKFWFNCNPQGPQHWFYTNWIKKCRTRKILYLHFTMDDNLSLSEEIKERYRKQYIGVFYDRYIRGLWVVAEGRVYPMFTDSPDRFILRGTTAGMDGQFYVSIDYGTVNPTAMQLWCIRGKEAIMLRESYFDSRKEGRQKTDEEHYNALEELTRGYYIRRVIVDPSAASFIETIRRHGNFRVWEAGNAVLDGIRVTATLLNAGMLKVHESCKDTIREFGLYRWDEKKNSDTVLKENDHAMDALRYFCYTVLAREFRWADWR